jgi:CPA2 family monovalent cation:H+ antiporter-2
MAGSLLLQTLVVILACVAAIGILTLLRLPPVLGYLLAGVVIGPFGLQVLAGNAETRFLAELGVIFLMFMVGLEMSLPAMIEARTDVFGAGSLQVALTAALVAAGAVAAGMGWTAAVLLGGTIAMSSTALTLKQLADRGEVGSQHGRLAVGILLFQDLATLPFLLVVTAWQDGAAPSLARIVGQMLVAAIALVAVAVLCQPLFRFLLEAMARRKSSDLFLLTVLLLALGTAAAVHLAGLPAPIGAFLAGMVIGQSDFRHQVEDDVRPFRDVLLGLFFVTVGMAVNPAILASAPSAVLVWLVALLFGKAVVILMVAAMLRWPADVGIRLAVILAHGGEFGLLLLTQAMDVGILAPSIGQPALLALAITIGLNPLLVQSSGWIAERALRVAHRAAANTAAIQEESAALDDHVLLCGCGRVGRLVALVLETARMPYIAIDHDPARVRLARRQNHKVVFGDAGRKRVLEAARLANARLVVVTFDHRHTVVRILHEARQRNPIIPSIVSTSDDLDLAALVAAGAGAVFPENLAAGLALADQVLLLGGLDQQQAAKVITIVRAELSPELDGRVGL